MQRFQCSYHMPLSPKYPPQESTKYKHTAAEGQPMEQKSLAPVMEQSGAVSSFPTSHSVAA